MSLPRTLQEPDHQASRLGGQQFADLPGEGGTRPLWSCCQEAIMQLLTWPRAATLPAKAQQLLKDNLGPSSVLGHVGVDKQISGSSECPPRRVEEDRTHQGDLV